MESNCREQKACKCPCKLCPCKEQRLRHNARERFELMEDKAKDPIELQQSVRTEEISAGVQEEVNNLKECLETAMEISPLIFESQIRYVKARRLIKRIKGIEKPRKKGEPLKRELSPDNGRLLFQELQVAKNTLNHLNRQQPNGAMLYDSYQKEDTLINLLKKHRDSNYVTKRGQPFILETLYVNNIGREMELKSCSMWFDELKQEEDEEEEEEEEEKISRKTEPLNYIERFRKSSLN